MKKLFITAILISGFAFSAQSQNISKNALGLRLGDNDGFGGELSYQRKLAGDHRLELDLGWRNRGNYYNGYGDSNAIKLAGLYQWVWNIDGDFNWYAGLGGGLANTSYSYDYKFDGVRYYEKDSYTYGFLAGDIGIEYDFDIPLLISLDFRPEFYLNTRDSSPGIKSQSYGSDIALGIRYQF